MKNQLIIWSSSYLFIFIFCFFTLKRNQLWKITSYRSTNNASTPIYPKRIQVTLPEENRPPPKHLSRLVNKSILLNLNIAFYFLNILASSDVLTWLTTNGHHRKTIEKTWQMVSRCKEMDQEYTEKNITRHFGQTYLLTNQFNPKIFKWYC